MRLRCCRHSTCLACAAATSSALSYRIRFRTLAKSSQAALNAPDDRAPRTSATKSSPLKFRKEDDTESHPAVLPSCGWHTVYVLRAAIWALGAKLDTLSSSALAQPLLHDAISYSDARSIEADEGL
eukprot:5936669-Prymnesium_polylepis.1